MKQFLILFTVLGLFAGSVATAEAATKKKRIRVERTVEGSYDTQWVPFSGLVTGRSCAQSGAVGCLPIQTRARESHLTAKVSDAHGQPVLVTVSSWKATGTGSGEWVVHGAFCGETKEPMSFPAGVELVFTIGIFWYMDWPALSCHPMFGTTGTISVTLSNVP
jgi:hypothetical protein